MSEGLKLPSIPTWQLKHSVEELMKKAVDEATFNRGYRMNAISPGELRFPSWKNCYERSLTAEEIRRRQLPTYIGVDLSGKKRPGNSIVALALDPQTHRKGIADVRFGAWTSPQTAQALVEVCSRVNVQFIQVENNAYQQSIIDWVQQEKGAFDYWMKVEPYTSGTGTFDPMYGLPSLEVEFKNGGWLIPYAEFEGHPTTCVCDWCHLDREFRFYPRGATSDGIMASFFARDAISKWAPRRGAAGTSGTARLNVR